jgi:hypothetical protein
MENGNTQAAAELERIIARSKGEVPVGVIMCDSEICIFRSLCERNEASGRQPEQNQPYFGVPPLDEEGFCGHWWPTISFQEAVASKIEGRKEDKRDEA